MAIRNNTFVLKVSNLTGKTPTIGNLLIGEIAVNTADAKLYSLYTGGLSAATEVRAIGWDRLALTGGTITGGLTITSLASGGVAPVTSGTTKMLVSDVNGLLSFQNIPSSSGGTGTTIYNGDSTLSGNRIVNQSTFNIIFSGSGGGTNKFSIFERFEAGTNVMASGNYSHAEGDSTLASGIYSHAEGQSTSGTSDFSHAEGQGTLAAGFGSHAEGYSTKAIAFGSHTEGFQSVANSIYSHAEGQNTATNNQAAHSEGQDTIANGFASHAEGVSTKSNGIYSHAEGVQTTSVGSYSHSEGYQTTSVGQFSHAEGFGTTSDVDMQHVSGRWNITGNTPNSVFIIGTGLHQFARADAFRVDLLSSAGTAAQITSIGNSVLSGSSTPLKIVGLTASTTDTNLLSIGSDGVVHTYAVSSISGGSGSGSVSTYTGVTTVDFGFSTKYEGDFASTAVTNSNITANSHILLRTIPSADHNEIEDCLLDGVIYQTSDIVAGVGFTLNAYALNNTWGKYNVSYKILN